MAILNDTDFVEVEGRQYINPQVALDESTRFIDNLRATQGQQNQEITQQTQRLGTDVPTNLGGLTGAESYFTSRYQTPETNAAIANLRATAQAQALNDVLANEQAIWKNRYQQAYRNYQKRQYDKANASSYGTQDTSITGGTEENSTSRTVGSVDPSFSPLDYSGNYSYSFNPNTSGGGLINNVTLTPSGQVDLTMDSNGNVTSLTYNGKTFSGNAAQQRYDYLNSAGTMTRIGG